MLEVGADGIDYDTVASTGDAEFLAALRASRAHPQTRPTWPVEIGMAAEMVLGFHGELEYDGVRLAGLWPHQQMQLGEKAGAAIFGPVVNTNTQQVVRLEPLPRRHLRQGLHREATKIPIHAERRHGRRRRADVRDARRSTS